MANKIKNKSLMTARPPVTSSAEDFILAAESKDPNKRIQNTYDVPWEEVNVREDVIKSINLRLSEPYILKLQFLSEKTNKSQQQIIREYLCPEIDREIGKILREIKI